VIPEIAGGYCALPPAAVTEDAAPEEDGAIDATGSTTDAADAEAEGAGTADATQDAASDVTDGGVSDSSADD
jgi:hypothetical protein